MMRKVIFFIMICAGYSCADNKSEPSTIDLVSQDTLKISKADIEKLNFTEFILDPASDKKLAGWLKYRELEDRINELKNADLSFFKGDKKIVETLIQEFMSTVPSNIDEESIQARILIVETMYLKLNNKVNLTTSTKSDIQKSISDLLEAFSNLNYQINKKFERDSQNIIKPQ